MYTSARLPLRGTVHQHIPGAANTEVELDAGDDARLNAMVTRARVIGETAA